MDIQKRSKLTVAEVIQRHKDAAGDDWYISDNVGDDSMLACDWWDELVKMKKYDNMFGIVTANGIFNVHESAVMAFKLMRCISLCPLPLDECITDCSRSPFGIRRSNDFLPSQRVYEIIEGYSGGMIPHDDDTLKEVNLLSCVTGWMRNICKTLARIIILGMQDVMNEGNYSDMDNEDARKALTEIMQGIAWMASYIYGGSSEAGQAIEFAVIGRICEYIGKQTKNPFLHEQKNVND